MPMPHVLILGAGFGGTYVARHLRRAANRGEIRVTVADRANHFLFTPLLHEVATGSLSPSSVAEPIREIFAGDSVDFLRGQIEGVDLERRVATIAGREVPYDYLVVALGSRSNDYGVPGVAEHALPLKRLADALKIRRTVIGVFEKLASPLAESPRLPKIVVVGGGATGVEAATELAEFAHAIAERYFPRVRPARVVTLLNAGEGLVSSFPKFVQRVAEAALEECGISVCHGCAVTRVTDSAVEREGAAPVPADLVVWAAGVAPVLPQVDGALDVLKGRIVVDEFLRARGRKDVFALGDAAATAESALPMLAQVATQQAKAVARNVLAAVRGGTPVPFSYRTPGTLVSLGRGHAAGVVFGVPISGKLAWFVWRTVYFFKFASHKKRLRIAFEWAIGIFFARETTEA